MPVVGADISCSGTNDLIEASTTVLGSVPSFFGRYFKGPGNLDPVQYQPLAENHVFRGAGIRILCIGRQTNRVSGDYDQGHADGVNNTKAVVSAFGTDHLVEQNIAPLIFLDTEPETSLSAKYYACWADALSRQISNLL